MTRLTGTGSTTEASAESVFWNTIFISSTAELMDVSYHLERNHQGLGNRLIIPCQLQVGTHGAIRRRQRLGGMLNYYYRQAA